MLLFIISPFINEVHTMDNKPFRQGTIDQFLDDLGSKKAAPGGGAAAGLVGTGLCAR